MTGTSAGAALPRPGPGAQAEIDNGSHGPVDAQLQPSSAVSAVTTESRAFRETSVARTETSSSTTSTGDWSRGHGDLTVY